MCTIICYVLATNCLIHIYVELHVCVGGHGFYALARIVLTIHVDTHFAHAHHCLRRTRKWLYMCSVCPYMI